MDAICLPGQLPATITRPRPLIEAVMAQSLREQGPASRTAAAWRWVLTGQGPAPVSDTPGTGSRPDPDEITAEARHGSAADVMAAMAERVRPRPGPAAGPPRAALAHRSRRRHPATGPGPRPVRRRAAVLRPHRRRAPPGPRLGPARHRPARRPARRHRPVGRRAALAVARSDGSTPPGSAAPSPTWTGYSATPRLPRSRASPSPSHPARTQTRA